MTVTQANTDHLQEKLNELEKRSIAYFTKIWQVARNAEAKEPLALTQETRGRRDVF